jgi:hypothetical protein
MVIDMPEPAYQPRRAPERIAVAVLGGRLAIVRCEPGEPLPDWLPASAPFTSVTRTAGELSIVCDEAAVPPGVRSQGGYRALAVEGPIPLDVVGLLARLARVLADAEVSIFPIATFDTDYILVPDAALARAVAALRQDGITIIDD